MNSHWAKLPQEVKRKLIEKVNERSDYEWKAEFWANMQYKLLPPVLKKELEREFKKLKFLNYIKTL